MKILVVEDMEVRNTWFRQHFIGTNIDFAYTVDQAKVFLDETEYDTIFLDHDLSDDHYAMIGRFDNTELVGTGADAAKYIVKKKSSPKAQIIVHSLNPSGSANIFAILNNAGYNVERIPFLDLQRRLR